MKALRQRLYSILGDLLTADVSSKIVTALYIVGLLAIGAGVSGCATDMMMLSPDPETRATGFLWHNLGL